METSTHQQHYQVSTKLANYAKPVSTKVFASLFCLFVLLPAVYNLVQLLCINMDKNYMFLLFNGILVILKFSCGITNSPKGSDLHGVSNERYYDVGIKEKKVHEPTSEIIKEVSNLKEGETECKEENSLILVEEESIGGILITEEVEGGQQENGNADGDADEIGLMSPEELNRKFDDFIREVRRGFETEAKQS